MRNSNLYIWIILCILLYIFKYIHAYTWDYKLVKVKEKTKWKAWQLPFFIVESSFVKTKVLGWQWTLG